MTSEDGQRATRPSIAEFRRVAQPPEVLGRRGAEHWTATLYLRRLSPHLSRVLIRTPVSANALTVAMLGVGVAAGSALLLPGLVGAMLAVLLGQLQMLLDCADGEVARWRGSTGARGVFLDRLAHYTAELVIAVALGVRVALAGPGERDLGMVVMGVALATLIVLNRAVNDMAQAARAAAGLAPVPGDRASAAPRGGLLARAWSVAGVVPLHRVFHSVELTLVVFCAAFVDLFWTDATRWLLIALVPLAALTVAGHVFAVLASRRLDP